MKKFINLNHKSFNITDFDFGKTDCIIKLGRKLWNLQIDRNAINFNFSIWDYNSKSKYEAPNYTFLIFKNYNNKTFGRNFFENMAKIKEASELLKRFCLNTTDLV